MDDRPDDDERPRRRRPADPPRSRRRKPPAAGSKRRGASADRTQRQSRRSGAPPKRKRTSRNSDERNPTRSGIDYPSRRFRRAADEESPPPPSRPALRAVGRRRPEADKPTRRNPRTRTTPPRRRRSTGRATAATEELARLAGRNAARAQEQLGRAAEAFSDGRDRDALRLARPLRDAYPDASAVRELVGLCHYRLGQYQAASRELDVFAELADSVEQHPVLMDCARAMRKYGRVEELWRELAASSPSGALVTEGRIVLAGSRADRGRLADAIATLDRRAGDVRRPQEHHLRLWYALADLYERAGDIPRARDLFARVQRSDASFADVAERLAGLG